VGVVSLANNHVLDFGLEGLADTISSLEAAGISHCGAALDVRDAYRPAVVTARGFRVAFLSYMQRYDIYTRDDVYATPEHGGVARLPIGRIREELDALGDATCASSSSIGDGHTSRSLPSRRRWPRDFGRRGRIS